MVCWTCNRQEKSPSRLLGGDFLLSKKKDEDGLVQGGYKSDQAEDNARDIGNKDRPVLVLLQKGVAAPKGAVDGGNQRLHGIAITYKGHSHAPALCPEKQKSPETAWFPG